ncbi:hypothetical protein ASF58_22840 [Methylobacterium sp. Leaf125]|nr:hypothetical protein ASF58_22840 [Methylobacterium sp. Leaf125]
MGRVGEIWEQHPEAAPGVSLPIHQRARLELYAEQRSTLQPKHQILALYVGFWSVHTVPATDQERGSFGAVCGFSNGLRKPIHLILADQFRP